MDKHQHWSKQHHCHSPLLPILVKLRSSAISMAVAHCQVVIITIGPDCIDRASSIIINIDRSILIEHVNFGICYTLWKWISHPEWENPFAIISICNKSQTIHCDCELALKNSLENPGSIDCKNAKANTRHKSNMYGSLKSNQIRYSLAG